MSGDREAAAADGDELIRQLAPGLWKALSALGQRIRQSPDFLPQQTAEARGKTFNATIGQITDGHGRAVELPALGAALRALPETERSRALLYSPLEGLPELRQRWRERQWRPERPDGSKPADVPWSLPLITSGPGLARQVLAELFVEEGRTVILALPSGAEIEGARELLELRRGARVLALPAAGGGGPDPGALATELEELPDGEPVVVLLAGHADGGLIEALAAAAERRPVVVLVEDDPGDPAALAAGTAAADPTVRHSAVTDPAGLTGGRLFRELAGRHPDLLPFRVEGAAKLGFPGAGLGFLTLPFPADAPLALAIEKKLKMLLRAAVGSPPALTQVLLLAAWSPP